MKTWIVLLGLCVALTSCATKPKPAADSDADTKLGLVQDEERDEAQKANDELQEAQRQEQKRRLERVVTDPLDNIR